VRQSHQASSADDVRRPLFAARSPSLFPIERPDEHDPFTETTGESSRGKAKYAKEHLRTPLPGNEVEFAVVQVAACKLIEQIDEQRDRMIEVPTHPRCPGLFSDALQSSLCTLADTATNAAQLLLRLRLLCGAKDVPEVPVSHRQRDAERLLAGLIEDEQNAVLEAARLARKKVMAARAAAAQLSDRCPKGGGATYECTADRRFLSMGGMRGRLSPARRCFDCDESDPARRARIARDRRRPGAGAATVNHPGAAGTEVARSTFPQTDSRALLSQICQWFQSVSWWALQDSNLRPLPCESARGSRQTYTDLVKSSQSLDIAESARSDLRHDLAPFFSRLGPNWVQCLSSNHFRVGSSRHALLAVRQVAQFLGVSTATVYRLCERGDLVHVRVSHGIRVQLPDLAAYVDRHRNH
jgi:excisionase family DNA binding protein